MLILAVAVISFVVYYQRRLMQAQADKQKLETEAQQRMLSATIQTQESERKRIAKDLHDEIGALLAAVRLGIIQISSDKTTGAFGAEKARETKSLIEETLKNVRRISQDLMPATLEKFGLISALGELCQKLEKTSGIRMDFTDPAWKLRLKPQSELAIYRMVQELINNALKHAESTKISINLQKTATHLYLSVSDDGRGFDLAHAQSRPNGAGGLGLSSVESRISLLNASIRYDTAPGRGTHIEIAVPLESNIAHMAEPLDA
jgi:signal transduction histidine kinase